MRQGITIWMGGLLAGLLTAGAVLAGTNPIQWTENVNPDVGRSLLSRAPGLRELPYTTFQVPAPVVEEYFRAQMARREAPVSDAPVPVLLGHWRVNLTIVSNQPAIQLECSGTAFRATPAEPVQVRSFAANLVYSDLQLNGRPVLPVRLRDCSVIVAVTNPGDFRITATVSMKPTENGPDRSLTFLQPGFAYGTVRVDSDHALEVAVSGDNLKLIGTPDHGTHGVLASGRRSPFTVTWRKPEPAPVRIGTPSVKPSFAWVIGAKTLLANGLLDVEILGGTIDRMAVALPGDADKIQVGGPDVKYFNRTGNRIDIFFRGTIGGRTSVRLTFETPRPRGNLVTCPEIEVPGGRLDQGGWLLVANDGGGELLEQTTQGFEPRASLQVPETVLGLLPGKPLFTYARTGFRGQAAFDHVATVPFPMVDTIADRSDVIAVVQPAGEEMVRIRYTVRNNRKQFLRMALPPNAQLLWAAVENKPVQVTRDERHILVPLAKSVQTLEGLVSLPVDIIYSRCGNPFANTFRRAIDLPELAEIPTALVHVTVFAPDGVDIRGTAGALEQVKEFRTAAGFAYGRGYERGGPRASWTAAGTPELVLSALSQKYYDAGYEAYRVGRLEEAEEMLLNVEKIAPEAAAVPEARNLLSNIRAGRGEVQGVRTREERARVANVQKGMQIDNAALEARQQDLVQNAVQMIQAGNEEIGAQLFDEAEAVGRKLVQRGTAQVEQKAVSEQFRDSFGEMRQRRKDNEELSKRLAEMQRKVIDISATTANKPVDAVKAQNFAVALSEAAAANAIAPDEIQSVAFGLVPAAAQQPVYDVDEKVIALQLQQDKARGAPNAPIAAPSAQRGGRSLLSENVRLRRQVAALEQAVAKAETAPADPAATKRSWINEMQLREARSQVTRAAETAESLARQVEGAELSLEALNEKKLQDRIASLRKSVDAYSNTFAKMDPTLERDVQSVREKLTTTETRLNRALDQKKKAQFITVNLGDIVSADSRSDQLALARFFSTNYLAQYTNNQAQFEIANGQLTILNNDWNPVVLSEALQKLQRNRGLAVPVIGRTLDVPRVGEIPVIGRLFTTRTGDGRRAAVLDEAQYRVLLEAAGPTGDAERREVIVGTPNRAGGEDFRLARNGRDYNGIEIRGTEIRLPNNRYLVVDNGTHVSVLKAGTAAPWQTVNQVVVPEVTRTVSAAPDLPCTGTPFYFEKTLLAAGESPDIVITYNYKERR